MSKTIYLNFPITIIKDIFDNIKGTFRDIAYWAASDVMRGFAVQYPVPKLAEANKVLQLTIQVNQMEYKQCLNIYSKYSGARTGLSKEHLIYLNKCWGFIKDSDKVLWLAFISAKSILGNKVKCQTNDLMLFARMNGLNRAFSNEVDLLEHSHPIIASFYTRRRRDTLRKRLAEEFHINTYSNHDRGYHISRKLSFEKLKELVELDKQQKKSYQGGMAEVNKKALEPIQDDVPEDSS